MAHALLFTGGGDYLDRWHPFTATAELIASALDEVGVRTSTVETVEALAAGAGDAELLVVQAGSDDLPDPHDDALLSTVTAHQRAGRPLLAVHAAAGLLPDRGAWQRALGGRWVAEHSWHPAYGEAEVRISDSPHPITEGIADFDLVDERYTALRVEPAAQVLAWHELDEVRHPLLWTWDAGGARVVYDALGHDTASYESSERVELLQRSARWLLGELY